MKKQMLAGSISIRFGLELSPFAAGKVHHRRFHKADVSEISEANIKGTLPQYAHDFLRSNSHNANARNGKGSLLSS